MIGCRGYKEKKWKHGVGFGLSNQWHGRTTPWARKPQMESKFGLGNKKILPLLSYVI